MLLATALLCSCALGEIPGDQEVYLVGVLILGRHDARLQDRVREPGSLECSLFVAFPGTPPFLTPGYDWENRPADKRLSAFSAAYQKDSKQTGFRPRRVVIRGTLVTGKRFGYRGAYRAAILVKWIDFSP